MRELDDLILDAALEENPLAERQPRQRNQLLLRPPRDDREFGPHVDEGGIRGREVEE